jgi:hypothetical protein
MIVCSCEKVGEAKAQAPTRAFLCCGAPNRIANQWFSLEKSEKTKGTRREAPTGFEPVMADLQSDNKAHKPKRI